MSKSKAAAKPTPSTTSTSSSWRPLLLVLLGALAGFFAARFQGADVSTPVQVEVDVTPSPAAPTPDASAASAAAANAARAARDVWTPDATTRVVSVSELREHSAASGASERWLAVLGEVFDVSAGGTYEKGGGYDFFTGVDGSAAFSTGEFNEAGLKSDIRALEPNQALDVREWLEFYRGESKYPRVGVLAELYYNEKGQRTEAWNEMMVLVGKGQRLKENEETMRKLWPGCNMRTNSEGRRFWCSTNSGGIQRGWVGRPRAFFTKGTKKGEKGRERCVCAPEDKLDDPRLRVYINCNPNDDFCVFPPEQKEI